MPPLNVREYISARHGASIFSRASADGVTLGTSVLTVLRQDATRVGFYFVNLSLNAMHLTPIGVPSAAKGFLLQPNGGTLIVRAEEEGEVVAWEWLGIADAAASPYFFLEAMLNPEGTPVVAGS